MVGSDVKLSCVYPGINSFDLNELYVYWQVSESNTVVTYYLPENSSTGREDSHYKNRAHLSLDSMKRGDFSLHLYNVTPQDEQKFNCLVFRKSSELGRILEAVVMLHVAGKSAKHRALISSLESWRRHPPTCSLQQGNPVLVTGFLFTCEASR